jgi:hypothetical protein|tara:strand:+ start:128 stop:439 length:312 start_codon:yes stop_codon:yes gene_type:complete
MNKEIGNVKEIMNQATVDSIAELRAEKARLTEIENRLMENLKTQGVGTYNGTEHYITVSEAERNTLDMKAVRKKLSRQFISANTKVTSYITAKIYGYTKKKVA